MSYRIEEHRHRFAAWAASSAAMLKGCRFPVATGKSILEQAGFDKISASPEQLPVASEVDACHRESRELVIVIAKRY